MSVKDLIITNASTMFEQFGVRSVSLEELCRSIGISKKTLYKHFESKESLTEELSAKLLQELGFTMIAANEKGNALDVTLSLWDTLRNFLNRYQPAYFRDLQKAYPGIWAHFEQQKLQIEMEVLKTNITDGIEQGWYRHDIDAAAAADLWMQMLSISCNTRSNDALAKEIFIRGMLTESGFTYFNQLLSAQVMLKTD